MNRMSRRSLRKHNSTWDRQRFVYLAVKIAAKTLTSSIKREVKKDIAAKNSFESLFFFVAAARKFNLLLFPFYVAFFPGIHRTICRTEEFCGTSSTV